MHEIKDSPFDGQMQSNQGLPYPQRWLFLVFQRRLSHNSMEFIGTCPHIIAYVLKCYLRHS
jgi:hypothetical protein